MNLITNVYTAIFKQFLWKLYCLHFYYFTRHEIVTFSARKHFRHKTFFLLKTFFFRIHQILEWNGVSLIDRSFEEVCSIMDRTGDVVDLLVEHATDFRMCDLLDDNGPTGGGGSNQSGPRKSGGDATGLGLVPGKLFVRFKTMIENGGTISFEQFCGYLSHKTFRYRIQSVQQHF